jgi:hypothetical protein
MRIPTTIIALIFVIQLNSTTITVIDPPELAAQFHNQPFSMHVSPIGFRPLSGRLEGKVVIANPSGACSMIEDVHSLE